MYAFWVRSIKAQGPKKNVQIKYHFNVLFRLDVLLHSLEPTFAALTEAFNDIKNRVDKLQNPEWKIKLETEREKFENSSSGIDEAEELYFQFFRKTNRQRELNPRLLAMDPGPKITGKLLHFSSIKIKCR